MVKVYDMPRALQIANRLIKFAELDTANGGELLSNLKLQKLLYYEQGFHLALFNSPLFSDDIEAWMYGPVVPSVYDYYKKFGSNGIVLEDDPQLIQLTPQEEDLLFQVYERYKSYSAIGLMDLTHGESPWINAVPHDRGTVISNESMRTFFLRQLDG
ncbi:Panacea domain-containing protein [Fibrobacter sp. UBA3718]|jgi:uncharacterized phage-associated protein|uniref:Panacea domain-containing protein n=1 Tax=Fibrobacter sp. UBA3718 TaxID=1946531 RepID=UPI0025B986A3|nr:type II toxin-antitoxin system antitoxin SocA domain-containing protein [Fibrobacter sp. UBA3718]